jgi:hypothetical protein
MRYIIIAILSLAFGSACAKTLWVSNTIMLKAALTNELYSTVQLSKGIYNGPITIKRTNFVLTSSCNAVIDGGSNKGAVLTIYGTNVKINFLSFRNAEKGIIVNNGFHNQISKCSVYNTLQEGIHILNGSWANKIYDCKVTNTGLLKPEFGEGIYIGSDYEKWDIYIKECDENIISNNQIGPDVRAECIDLKEGSSYNIITKNIFYASGIVNLNGSSSFIDIKGNRNIIDNNTGYQDTGNITACYELHRKMIYWGQSNTVVNNMSFCHSNIPSIYQDKGLFNWCDCNIVIKY